MKEQIELLIHHLESNHDFDDEFYRTYIGELNDGDISDWHNNHFDDNISTGVDLGQTMLASDIIEHLKSIIGEE
jgi:hypothetical protein